MQMYCLVDPNGYIIKTAIEKYREPKVAPGYRLLPDNIPSAANGDYIINMSRPVRVEPIPLDAIEVPYIIENIPNPYEVPVVNPDVEKFIQDVLNAQSSQ